ncbi:hypothetical protein V9W64_10875 [Neisseria leonii]|uniref:Uncharacterized protein n=1 Tax=Neisseria leonii TaxID=2995413 RepID=A0A9X4E1B3_9NEIS|nr:hypothetical protein [Neisseria sp. 51.81]MDD9326745.1 hypothetical protein [Neisseria sp. 51.81]
MNRLDFRDALTVLLRDAYRNRKDVRIHYENGPNVDMGSITVPVLSVETVYSGSFQADLSEMPRTRDNGNILITVLVRGASGSRTAVALRDEAAGLLQRKRIGGALTHTASILPNSDAVKGWVGYRAEVPFWHYHF